MTTMTDNIKREVFPPENYVGEKRGEVNKITEIYLTENRDKGEAFLPEDCIGESLGKSDIKTELFLPEDYVGGSLGTDNAKIEVFEIPVRKDDIKTEVSLTENWNDGRIGRCSVEKGSESVEEITIMKTEVTEETYNFKTTGNKTVWMSKRELENKAELEMKLPIKNPDVESCPSHEKQLQKSSHGCSESEEETQLTNRDRKCCFKTKNPVRGLNGDPEALVCSYSNTDVVEEKSYKQHIKQCSGNYLRSNKKEDVSAEVEVFRCNKCTYTTKWKSTLLAHITVHSNKKDFKCKVCGKSFRLEIQLRYHTKRHDGQRERKHPCPHCTNSYYTKACLTNHMNIVHLNYKEHRCEACGYATVSKHRLNDHVMALHSGAQKGYRCGDCEYTTHYKSHLVRHSRTHSDVKQFECTHRNCAGTCAAAQGGPCECGPCEFTTAYRRSLKRHVLLRHVREKPFKCGYQGCVYAAGDREHLKRHIRYRHTHEKLFCCDKCEYSCVNSTNLKSHIKRRHS